MNTQLENDIIEIMDGYKKAGYFDQQQATPKADADHSPSDSEAEEPIEPRPSLVKSTFGMVHPNKLAKSIRDHADTIAMQDAVLSEFSIPATIVPNAAGAGP